MHLSLNGFQGKIEWMGFGAARTGNDVFHKHFNRLVPNSIRVVNKKDSKKYVHLFLVVTRLPPIILGFRHVLREHWFEKDSRSYKLCSATDSEDPTCSKSFLVPSITDHLQYLDHDMRDGHGDGCQ
jgi:hypothetical protein